MIVAHITGMPVEESVLQLAPTGAAIVMAISIAGRVGLGRLRRRFARNPRQQHTKSTGCPNTTEEEGR